MAYVTPDYPSKKKFREAVEGGFKHLPYNPSIPGLGIPVNGELVIEGPHYPKPHKWYARVEVRDGVVVRVLS